MIKSLTVTNHLGNSIKLELGSPASSGFIVKSIDGLGPAKANVNMSNLAMHDGSIYNSARLNSRDIILTLEFMQSATESIEDIRHKSYKYFPIKKKVCITIETDRRIVETEGYVEANEPSIFSSTEGCSITIACPSSYLYSAEIQETMFSGVEPMFSFPFENESTTEPLLEMGIIEHKKEGTVYYPGDVEVGININIHAIGPASNLKIYNLTTGETMHIDSSKLETITGSDIIAGDTININTVKGSKSITLLRDGKTYNILNCLGKATKWFTIVSGDNIFAYRSDDNSEKYLQFHISNKIAYEGV